jgi:hypothetical protein
MRWLAASFFFLVAAAMAILAVGSFSGLSADYKDTADGIIIGAGILFLLSAGASVFGGLWVLRRWPDKRS